jgi:hypothetical protein
MDQLTEEQRKLNNVELQNLISSVFTIRIMKSRSPEGKACSTHDTKQATRNNSSATRSGPLWDQFSLMSSGYRSFLPKGNEVKREAAFVHQFSAEDWSFASTPKICLQGVMLTSRSNLTFTLANLPEYLKKRTAGRSSGH